MAKLTENDIFRMRMRYKNGATPIELSGSFNIDSRAVRYHLTKSNDIDILNKLYKEAECKLKNAKSEHSKTIWLSAVSTLSARIAYLRANHRSQPTSD